MLVIYHFQGREIPIVHRVIKVTNLASFLYKGLESSVVNVKNKMVEESTATLKLLVFAHEPQNMHS